MSNWKLINSSFLYDGTFEGLLTVIFECYVSKTLPQNIFNTNIYYHNFLDKTIYIKTDLEKSSRIFKEIEKNICHEALYNCFNAFLCDEKDKEINILKYICNGFDIGPKINNMLAVSYVYKVINMKKKSSSECHRLKGLTRFIELNNNLYYCKINPDNNIIEPLAHHFINRFPSQNFIMHDENRDTCLLYNGHTYEIINCKCFNLPNLSNDEKKYQQLWQLFFNTISIDERANYKCQRQFMPKKYWKNLIENPYIK